MSFRRQVGTGLFWVAVATIATKALSLLRKLILARLLVPSDFGLVGYASLMLGVLALFKEMGFSSALIYRKDDVEEAANTTFYVVIASGVLLYILAFFAAPALASFFRNDALVAVLRVLGLTLVISSISQVPLTLMAKGMGFRKKIIPELIANVIGAVVSVVLALLGYKVWAIVYGQLITSTLLSILVWFFHPWRPKLSVDRRVAGELWDYGKHIISSQLMVFAITNIDDAFIGRLLGDASLGTYQLAYDLSNLPATHLSRIVGQVMFPAFSRIQNDMQKLKRVFFQSMKFVSLAAIPIAIITMVFAADFIDVAYGKKWLLAVTPLQLLTIYGLARSIAVNMGNVFKVGGRPKWLLYVATVRLVVMGSLLYPAIRWNGVTGVAVLSAVVAIVDWFLSMFLTNRIIDAKPRDYAKILVPPMLTAIATAWVAHQVYLWSYDIVHPFIGLPTCGALALAMYAGIMYLYDGEIRDLAKEAIRGALREVQRVRMAREHSQA